MSLETFISRDLEVLQHQLQAMESEQNQDNADELSQTNEKITTEDILGRTDGSSQKRLDPFVSSPGNISESDSSDDDDTDRRPTSSLTSQHDAGDEFDADPTGSEHASRHRQHKHAKKRLKTTHAQSDTATATSAAASAALQLSEDEL